MTPMKAWNGKNHKILTLKFLAFAVALDKGHAERKEYKIIGFSSEFPLNMPLLTPEVVTPPFLE